jgi:hypothetical protein
LLIREYSADGKYVRTVADTSMLEGMPAWTAAGDRSVYRVGGPGQSDSLWIAAPGGGAAALVHRFASNTAAPTPVSPDGERVLFVDSTGIGVVPISGGRAVEALKSADISGACWSADGEWIWFSEGVARLARVPAGGGEPVRLEATPGLLRDCSPDGRWLARRIADAIVLTSTDGKAERVLAKSSEYASRAEVTAQFGEGGRVLYLLSLDRRTVDVIEVSSGRKLRAVTFHIPPGDQIEGYAFSPDGRRVLLTTGGDRSDLWIAEGFATPATGWKRWLRHWEPSPGAPGK